MSWDRGADSLTAVETGSGSSAPTRSLVLSLGWFPDHPGGLTRYVRGLTEALAADGRGAPRVLALGPVSNGPEFLSVVSDETRALPQRLAAFAAQARRSAHSVELVDAHFALYAWPCLLVPSLRRLPLVVHFHGPWAAEFVANGEPPGVRTRLRRALERSVYRRADAFVTLSDAFKQVLVDDFGVAPERVHVLGAGVELDRFSPGDRGGARNALGIAGSTWTAVAVRRLDPRMGLDVLLRAWADVDIDDRVLLIAGDGPSGPSLRALADELGLGDRVRFLGRVSEERLPDLYRAADVAVVPSVALEGFGLVVLEALGCGVPVVGTAVGGLGETLAVLDPSLVVPPGDPAALAARLSSAHGGTEPPPSAEACRRFAERFSWVEVASRHRELYRTLLSSRRIRRLPPGH